MTLRKTFTENRILGYIAFTLMFLAFVSSNVNAKSENKPHHPHTNAENINLTESDIRYAKQKVELGITTLNTYWRKTFATSGYRYRPPKVYYYYRPIRTACGTIPMQNAAYCGANNSIYFDIVYFTQMMRAVGNRFGTDGDMAIITVLAHEWGHAVQAQTKNFWHLPVLNELGADCFAGAFVGNASRLGYIERGDSEEAMLTLAIGGDNAPWYSPQAHGNSKQRMSNFNKGFRQGLTPCIAR